MRGCAATVTTGIPTAYDGLKGVAFVDVVVGSSEGNSAWIVPIATQESDIR
jgi:hypothetical protein